MTTIEALRAWAAGSCPDAAAGELLTRAFSGRFAATGRPWIAADADGHERLDADSLRVASALSGGEHRILTLVAALVDGQPVEIVDFVSGLDRHHLDLVLAALAHAAGSHEHTAMTLDAEGRGHLTNLGPLHPWPDSDGR